MELLTHVSVIPGQLQLYRHAHTREDLLEAIQWQLPRADSPDRVSYTSKGYIVLGEVISAVDGASLDEVVSRRVLKPLGMRDTCFTPPERLMHRVAPTEDCPWRGKVVRGQVHDENAVVMGGRVWSCGPVFHRWRCREGGRRDAGRNSPGDGGASFSTRRFWTK